MNFAGNYLQGKLANQAFGIELAFATKDVNDAFDKAVASGAIPLKQPEEKP